MLMKQNLVFAIFTVGIIIIAPIFVAPFHYSNPADALFIETRTGPWPEQMIASDKNVYLLLQDRVGNLYFKRSVDNGATFENTIKIGSNSVIMYEPEMAVSGNHVYVAWDYYAYSHALMFRRSIDNGTSFDDAIVLSNKTGGSKLGKLAVSDNYVYVAYSESSDNYDQIIFRRSSDNGKTFEDPIVLNDAKRSAVGLNMAVSGNSVYVVWFQDLFCAGVDPPELNCEPGIVFRKSSDNGKTFGDAITIPIRSIALVGGFPQPPPAIASSGDNVYIAWWDYDRTSNKSDIFLAKSDGNGFKVTNLTKGERHAWEMPRMIASSSNVYVFWQTPTEESELSIILSRSADYGATFEKIMVPYNFTSPFNLFRQVALSDDNIYFVRGSNNKVFFSASRDNGHTFSDPLVFTTDEFPSGYIAASGNNVYLLAFSSNFPASQFEASNETMIFKRSVDGGKTFGETIVLKHDSTLMPKLNTNSISLGEPEIVTEYSSFGYHATGYEMKIQSELKNMIKDVPHFTYIVQVKDRDGITVYLDSIEGSLAAKQSRKVVLAFIPESAGRHEIETFVWTDLLRPVPLSTTKSITVTFVNGTGYGDPYDKERAVRSFEFQSEGSSKPKVVLNQGEWLELPLQVRLASENYGILWMDLSLEGLPSNVHAWITRNELRNTVGLWRSSNTTVPIYAVSYAQPGNYTLRINGTGNMINLLTGEVIGIGSEIGSIHLEIKPKPFPITVDIGYSTERKNYKFCVPLEPSGEDCFSFSVYKEYPITVFSPERTKVKLNVLNVPKGVWVKLVPQELDVGPNGTSAKMMVAGGVYPYTIPTGEIVPLIIQAEYKHGNAAIGDLLARTSIFGLTVLHSIGPIEFPEEAMWFGPMDAPHTVFGALYDPRESSNDSLSVHLSVLGVLKEGKILPLPSGLKVDIPNPSFILNASQPHYFLIKTYTASAPLGTHTIAIEEIIDGQRFIEKLQIRVVEPIRL